MKTATRTEGFSVNHSRTTIGPLTPAAMKTTTNENRRRYLEAQAAWIAHRDACADCTAAWEQGEPTDCPKGDELVCRQDHLALEPGAVEFVPAATPAAPGPRVGDDVTFRLGITRHGRIVKVGPRRAHVAFQYSNGRQGLARIGLDQLTKNAGFGWTASRWWNR